MIDFTKFNRSGGTEESCYRLRNEPVKLSCKMVIPLKDSPGTDAWEGEGGAYQPLEVELAPTGERYKTPVRMRLGRGQMAAKRVRPTESVKTTSQESAAPLEVGVARFEGKSEKEIEIAKLEARIRALLDLS